MDEVILHTANAGICIQISSHADKAKELEKNNDYGFHHQKQPHSLTFAMPLHQATS